MFVEIQWTVRWIRGGWKAVTAEDADKEVPGVALQAPSF